MKFSWEMPAGLRTHYKFELDQYKTEILKNNIHLGWKHLERAHIIGQAWFKPHTYVHWLMFRFGIRIKSKKEILGQLPRLLLGGVKSFVGIIPVGNTGDANVPPLKAMEIPEDLKKILEPYKSL